MFIFVSAKFLYYSVCNFIKDDESGTSLDNKAKSAKYSSNAIDFYCSICKLSLKLNSVEILRHKKSHASE